jgi:hypothetical protein
MEYEDDDLLWVLFVEQRDGCYLALEMDGEKPRYAGIEEGVYPHPPTPSP